MKKLLLLAVLSTLGTNLFANLSQSHWRWRNNNGTQTTANFKAAEDVTTTINDMNAFRLRIAVHNGLSELKTFNRKLQYASSPNGPWKDFTDATPIQAFVYAGNDAYLTNGEATTNQLTASTYPFVPGKVVTKAGNYNDTILPSTSTEYEWSIKATKYAQPNTQYYFKAADGDAPAVLPSVTTGNSFSAKQIMVSNGGFENGLTDWTTTPGNAGNSLTVVQNYKHTGANGLKITVADKGVYNSVKLSHSAFAKSGSGKYIVRFWSIASVRNALLTLNIKTVGGNDTCHFQVYDRFNAAQNFWQMYQYAFETTAGEMEVEFRFNSKATYYLDDVEVIADNDPNIDVATTLKWQNNHVGYGWLSGDNNYPVMLPDRSVAWIFSDSFVGDPKPESNVLPSNKIINNLVVHDKNNQLTSIYGGSANSAQSLFSPGNGNVFWNSGGAVEGDTLRVALIEIAGGNYNSSFYIGSLLLPSMTKLGLVKTAYTGPIAPNAIYTEGGYHYLYFSERVGTFENYSFVGRVPVGKLSSSTTAVEFYTNEGTWGTDYTQHKRIVAGVEAASVIKLGTNNYVMSGVPNLSDEVAVWFATSPLGPWVNKTVVYNIPQEEGVLPYQGHIDEASGKDSIYTLTYSLYPFSGLVPQQVSDKGTYLPGYVKANLFELSPFTNNSALPVSLIRFDALKEGSKVNLRWTTASELNNNTFIIDKSGDGRTWISFAEVKGKGTTSAMQQYSVIDNQPLSRTNFYRLKQLDLDGRVKDLGVRTVTFGELKNKVSVYPNPAPYNGIGIHFHKAVTGKVTATLIDVQGRVIHKEVISSSTATGVCKLNVTSKPATGRYILLINGKEIKETVKLYIE
jgi:hypothetical protein